jgi:hypothetical protein
MSTETMKVPKERAGVETHPESHPVHRADLGASLSYWLDTDIYLAALVAASKSSPTPETPTRSLDVTGGSSETDRTSDSAWQGNSSPGYTWSSRLRRKLLARRRRPSKRAVRTPGTMLRT